MTSMDNLVLSLLCCVLSGVVFYVRHLMNESAKALENLHETQRLIYAGRHEAWSVSSSVACGQCGRDLIHNKSQQACDGCGRVLPSDHKEVS